MDIADCATKVYIECFYMLYYRYKKYLKRRIKKQNENSNEEYRKWQFQSAERDDRSSRGNVRNDNIRQRGSTNAREMRGVEYAKGVENDSPNDRNVSGVRRRGSRGRLGFFPLYRYLSI